MKLVFAVKEFLHPAVFNIAGLNHIHEPNLSYVAICESLVKVEDEHALSCISKYKLFDKLLFEKEVVDVKINKENTIVFTASVSLFERSSLSRIKFSPILRCHQRDMFSSFGQFSWTSDSDVEDLSKE